MPNPSQKFNPENINGITLGTTLVAGIAFFSFLGFWIGKKVGHEDAGMLIGIFMGLTYGGYEVWRVIRKLNENEQPKKSSD